MQITKFGHSCVLLDDGQTKILFDPGVYSDLPNISPDAIIITHVHQDHVDVDKFPTLLNAAPRVITNTQVKEELDKHGIKSEVLEQGQSAQIGTISLDAHGNDHAIIHPELPKFQNTGYLVNGTIFHPGDALFVPPGDVEVLLLPLAAPWSKLSETLDYISAVKAKINFPIHDAFLNGKGAFHRFATMWCEKYNLEFIDLEYNKQYTL